MSEKANTLTLDTWFKEQCDGRWEHLYGIKIETTDNPGWLVTVDLDGTLCSYLETKGKEDGLNWEAADGKLYGYCKPLDLNRLILRIGSILSKASGGDYVEVRPLEGKWDGQCSVCGKIYPQWAGSTPCCGGLAYVINHIP